MINACPNLTVLKMTCYSKNDTAEEIHHLFKQIILKCKKIEIFNFAMDEYEEPVSINHLAEEMSKNLVHLKQLYLPNWILSDYYVRLLRKNISSLKIVRVYDGMFVRANVTQTEMSNFFKDFHTYIEKKIIVETEIF